VRGTKEAAAAAEERQEISAVKAQTERTDTESEIWGVLEAEKWLRRTLRRTVHTLLSGS